MTQGPKDDDALYSAVQTCTAGPYRVEPFETAKWWRVYQPDGSILARFREEYRANSFVDALNAAYTAGLAAQREGEIAGLEKAAAIADTMRADADDFGNEDDAIASVAMAIRAEIESVLHREAEASRHPTSDTSGPDPVTDRNRPA